MKKIIIALVILLFFSLPFHSVEAKTKKVKRIQKTKIINCGINHSSGSKVLFSSSCYQA